MTSLDIYRLALEAASADAGDAALGRLLAASDDGFATFAIAHGLGPLWHARSGHEMFREARMAAEALYLAQEAALLEITAALDATAVPHAVFKGGANRLLLYDPPALRACYDLDILVTPGDRVRAARVLADLGYRASPDPANISRELVLSRAPVDVDLHWSLLREGRVRGDNAEALLSRRRRHAGMWMLDPDDAFFVLLVHPAFGKHLSSWNMGLHRVADIIFWLRTQAIDWPLVRERLRDAGVRTAAWATLRWVRMLAEGDTPAAVEEMLWDLRPARWRCRWIEGWLERDLPRRYVGKPWFRQLGFTTLLHDSPADAWRAAYGRYRAWRRRDSDMAVFEDLLAEQSALQ